jgi:hypothetical protein
MAQQTVSEAPLNYSKEIDLSNFSPGIYSVNVITNIGEQHKLFIKL